MGGTACALPRHALLRFDTVPSSHKDQKQFDEQIRQCYANSLIVQGIIEHWGEAVGVEAYKILELQSWKNEHRQRLLDILDGLYEEDA